MISPFVPAIRVAKRSHASYDSGLPDVFFYDDFEGAGLLDAWSTASVGDGSITLPDNESSGILRLRVTTAAEFQDAAIDFGDVLNFDCRRGLVFETRVRFVGVDGSGGTPPRSILGMGSQLNLPSPNNTLIRAWFQWQTASMALTTDDGIIASAGRSIEAPPVGLDAWRTYTIDFTNIADVRFYINGFRQLSDDQDGPFDMSAVTNANAIIQPRFSMDHSDGGGQPGDMDIDYVKFWQRRMGTSL